MTSHYPLVSYQPLRILFQATYIVLMVLRLPYYTIISLIPRFRPHKKWSAKQTFMTRVSYWFLDCVSRVGITETLTLNPGKEVRRFQVIPVCVLGVYKGPLASQITKPATVGGTWFPDAPGDDVAAKTVVLYFHGGAFVQGDGRTAQYGSIARYFLEKGSGDAVFSLQYRLSGHGGINPFPAALQDTLSSYLFLLNDLHISAGQIILAGDSAGAVLAVSLLRYIYEFGAAINVPTPKCAVLLSPWVEPFYYDAADNPHRGTDFIPGAYGGVVPQEVKLTAKPAWGAHAYTGNRPKTDPYITLLGNAFPTPVPLFVNAGSAELFCQRIVRWAEEMRGVEGNRVEVHCEEGAVHDTFFVGGLMGFEGRLRGRLRGL
ncbi:Acetyl-hydrolase [Lachnellula suecica]|uniref:Acetyl-hydrolase n=1 Tax=Lachnellula suecica TaxID=602035 RepID=A0A8T9CR94_9HELO|nr:Acetyl-hydrolase [Lachnellula suecica]